MYVHMFVFSQYACKYAYTCGYNVCNALVMCTYVCIMDVCVDGG